MTRIKICGITNLEDALQAAACGADALGFVFFEKSPRCITAEQAREIIVQLPPLVTTVGLFVNEEPQTIIDTAAQCQLDRVQLHGDETPEDCRLLSSLKLIKALRVRDSGTLARADDYPFALLLDAWSDQVYGGSGHSFDWQLARELAGRRPIILAGGLRPDNVARAIDAINPYAVDVSSGVERTPGKKDHEKVAEFIRRVRN
ncbi:MAG TPA: phosphoribosylanthranilate isomerase [Geopsychrobacteraceae bacterium]|nr:phosphoribosylanthranilate isomerase [Geopsychrobacteraceae bacterium]